MKQLDILQRNLAILRLVDRPYSYPSIKTIVDRLQDQGFEACSERTFSEDKKNIKDWYSINIAYSKQHRGYYLKLPPDEDISDFRQFIQLLERSERLQFLTHSQAALQSSRYLYLEGTDEAVSNRPALQKIWDALNRQVVITFSYQAFTKPQPQEYQAEPVLIMEAADHRWYLVAWHQERFKTFGLERIVAGTVALTNQPIKKNRQAEFRALKENALGVHISSEDKPQRIRLRFSPEMAPYVCTMPIHSSQQIITEDADGLVLELELVVNKELERLILSYGRQVEVLEPKALKETIKDSSYRIYKKYDSSITITL